MPRCIKMQLTNWQIFLYGLKSSPVYIISLTELFFRGFDYSKWEPWASDADSGWGAWSVETGWTVAWVSMVLGFRSANVSLWDIATNVTGATEEFNEWIPVFFPHNIQPESQQTAQ